MYLSVRERQAFADIERHLGAEDPELARRIQLISTLAVSPAAGDDEPQLDIATRAAPAAVPPPPAAPATRQVFGRARRPDTRRPVLASVILLLVVVAALAVTLLTPRSAPRSPARASRPGARAGHHCPPTRQCASSAGFAISPSRG